MTKRFALLLWGACALAFAQSKPPLTIDDLFSSVDIRSPELSSDGTAAVFVTTRADWKNNRFRDDIWLWRQSLSAPVPLTQSGHDSEPHWSPDQKYVAFISDRPIASDDDSEGDDTKDKDDKDTGRVWIIAASGGEAFPLYREKLKVHSFAWSRDGSSIFFSAEEPLSKKAAEDKKKAWKDVQRWREDERGDLLLRISLSDAVSNANSVSTPRDADKPDDKKSQADEKEPPELPATAKIVARSRYAIGEISPSPATDQVAFLTNSISGRVEHPEAYEIYLVDSSSSNENAARQLTHNEALERQLQWRPDGSRLHFGVFAASGNLDGKYKDLQGRLYSVDPVSGQVKRLGQDFAGSWSDYRVSSDGTVLGLGQKGTETQLYSLEQECRQLSTSAGTYEHLATARHSPAAIFTQSAVDRPTELYFLKDIGHPGEALPITHVNDVFTKHALPKFKPFRWKSNDGRMVEGVLLYPPEKFEQKHLRMLTLIHGGPADADGNRFGADWYSWAQLAAASGWLVFEPNYRGSTGYGDDFMTAISPHIVSAPGKDILTGVDALVADGTADPAHLAVGGYSYGGYMTNWLITQTTRFQSAITGAGAVEHASNWGNDDLTYDDAWYLGGRPWEKPEMYQSEAALFQFDKVKTPVHDVIGADDVRVSASQGYLLERALDALGVPHKFLIFPGEGHGLGKNPWHGYIKVREELGWLEKYDQTK
jgi:dipeptidyl aminopeptidase/acylaminoacyl peptidase